VKNNFALYIPAFGFILAIFVSSFFKLGFSFSFCLIFISVILFIFQRFFVADSEEKKKIFFIAIFILLFAVGCLRYTIADSNSPDIHLESAIGTKVTLAGIISDEPQQKASGVALTVDLKNLIAMVRVHPFSEKYL
jgi:hypothetical protein